MGTNTATEKSEKSATFDITRRDDLMDLGFRVEGVDGQYAAVDVMNNLRRVPVDGTVIDLDMLLVRVREDIAKNGPSEGARVGKDHIAGAESNVVSFKGIEDAPAEELEESAVELDPDEHETSDGFETEESDPAVDVIDHDGDQNLLPGQELLRCQPLTDAALAYHSAKRARVDASALEKATKDQLKLVAGKDEYQKFFTPDPDNTDSKIYIAGRLPNGKNVVVRERKTWEEELTTEESYPSDDGGSNKKGRKKNKK